MTSLFSFKSNRFCANVIAKKQRKHVCKLENQICMKSHFGPPERQHANLNVGHVEEL